MKLRGRGETNEGEKGMVGGGGGREGKKGVKRKEGGKASTKSKRNELKKGEKRSW